MKFEYFSLEQCGLRLVLAAALWTTACGGSAFFESGSAGATGTAGAGAAGTAGTGGDGADASGAGGGGSGGSAVCTGACPAIGCGPGFKPVTEPGACCPTCLPDGGTGGCGGAFACPALACAKGFRLEQQAGLCCPTCVPDNLCGTGQQGYAALRQKLLAQPEATACLVSKDCALLAGSAYCGDQCSQVPVSVAAAPSIDIELGDYAGHNCSTCTPIYPPCVAPLPPSCVQGVCVSGNINTN